MSEQSDDIDDLLEKLDDRIRKAKGGKRRSAERNGDLFGLSHQEWCQRLQAFQTARKDVADNFDS